MAPVMCTALSAAESASIGICQAKIRRSRQRLDSRQEHRVASLKAHMGENDEPYVERARRGVRTGCTAWYSRRMESDCEGLRQDEYRHADGFGRNRASSRT